MRKAQFEDMQDKQDFNNYKKNNTNLSDLINKPEISVILSQLIALI